MRAQDFYGLLWKGEATVPNETTAAVAGSLTIDPETLQEIIRRIVAVANPERIILFGSAARTQMHRNSDLDLLVVKSEPFDHARLVGDIYVNLHGVGQAVDVVLVTPDQAERYRDTHCLVIAPALREGIEVYHGTVPAG